MCLAAVAIGARAANLSLPDSTAGQVALEGCDTGLIALGGTKVFDVTVDRVTYRVHMFDTAGAASLTMCVPSDVEYLVVGGGGAGRAGGGDGGTVVSNVGAPDRWAVGSYPVVVGSGGVAGGVGAVADGGISTFGNVTANGGGAGDETACSGGDGAGGAGGTSGKCVQGAPGGVGLTAAITGEAVVYAGGGGGGDVNGPQQLGGDGGGGDGGVGITGSGSSGTAGTGGGGGGAVPQGSGSPGAGGSGVVIVRYPV